MSALLRRRCLGCGTTRRMLDWHHVQYRPPLVLTLCRRCHDLVHWLSRRWFGAKTRGLYWTTGLVVGHRYLLVAAVALMLWLRGGP
jgi:hypothetical protein